MTAGLTPPAPAHAASPRRAADPHERRHAARRLPGLWPTLAAAGLVWLSLELGNWQWRKAEAVAGRAAHQAARAALAPAQLPATGIGDPSFWVYRPVFAEGQYLAAGQILLDNQVRAGRPGVSVLTPLQLAGSERVVLVDRGWLPTTGDPRAAMSPPVPDGPQRVAGLAWPAEGRSFALAPDTAAAGGNARWQQLDLARYAKASGRAMQPLVIRLAPAAADGFLRSWPAAASREPKHRSYALQWFAFAATIAGLWLIFAVRALLRRPNAPGAPQ